MARSPSFAWLLAGSLLLGGCGGNNSNPTATAPGLGAPANPASTPRPEAGSEKITVKGEIKNAVNGEAVENAILIVQALTGDALPQASNSAAASGSPPMAGMPGAPGMPGGPSPVPSPLLSPTPLPTVGGRQGATAPRRPAPQPDDPLRPRKISVDGQGQFEIPAMAPGTYQITAYAPGYEALTVLGNRPSQSLSMPLVPQKAPSGYELSGKVMTAAKKPASGASVVVGLPAGRSAGELVTTGAEGGFVLKDLRRGLLPLAAFLEEDGEIKAWALQKDVSVAQGPDKKVASPELTLRAVNQPLILSGVATTSAADLRPRQVSVLLTTPSRAEIPLLTRTPDREGYFRFGLPALNAGETYHLVAVAASKRGEVVFQHRHKLSQSDLKLEIAMPAPPKQPALDTSLEPNLLTWEAQDIVSAYRVRLETVEGEGETVWQAYVTGTRVTLPDPELVPILKRGYRYRISLSAIKVVNGFDYQLANLDREPWDTAATSVPLEFVYGDAAGPPPVLDATGSPVPLVSPRPNARATAKPTGRPGPKATPKVLKPTPKPAGKPGRIVEREAPPRA